MVGGKGNHAFDPAPLEPNSPLKELVWDSSILVVKSFYNADSGMLRKDSAIFMKIDPKESILELPGELTDDEE